MNADAPRVLVVDDDPDIRANLGDVLTDMGYNVDTAADGPAALKLATSRRYDVALLDLKMPGMDGIEVYRRIKEARSGTVAILITAYASEETEQSALDAGAWEVMSKPLDFHKLVPVLEDVVKRPLMIVVDDDREVTESLWDILRERRYRVCTARDVRQADVLLHENRYDVALIDMKLPGGDGTQVLRAVRQTNPQARCVVITGHREMAADLDGPRGAVEAVCFKPVNVEQLVKTVEKLIA